MMSPIRILLGLAASSVVLSAGQVLADDERMVTEEETTTYSTGLPSQQQGTVSQIGPTAIVIRPMNAPNSVTYRFDESTMYVDESGNPVSIHTVEAGVPVVVYYDKAGSQTTATKVVVKKRTIEEDD
jgi:hypothetical protein